MKQCYFCTNNTKTIDYKDVESLKTFTDSYGRIIKSRRSGLCSLHQRQLASAIKQARQLALLPFIAN
ncbi:MAG: 30S ribosomal protein S18 [Candidatus Vogelbacteria bacterium]|nr:30S ribosomal protein S18 [Candidatus Vogelbacteria bacterium]